MDVPQVDFTFAVETWKIKAIERKRGRMKFQLKLNKEETEGFTAFSDQLKPDEMSSQEWLRAIFYKGLEKIQEDIMEGMQKYMEEHKDEIDASAVELSGELIDQASSFAAPEVIE